jgi:predicted kinase
MKEASPAAARILEQIETSEKPIVIMGIGIPASGKTTVLEEVAWHTGPNIRTVNVDAIRTRFIALRAGNRLSDFIDQEMYGQIQDDLDTKQLAIVDGTNIETMRRQIDVGRYRDLGAICVGGVFMDVGAEVALDRNSQREVRVTSQCIQQMHSTLENQRPSIDEGFDWLLTTKPDEITVTARV